MFYLPDSSSPPKLAEAILQLSCDWSHRGHSGKGIRLKGCGLHLLECLCPYIHPTPNIDLQKLLLFLLEQSVQGGEGAKHELNSGVQSFCFHSAYFQGTPEEYQNLAQFVAIYHGLQLINSQISRSDGTTVIIQTDLLHNTRHRTPTK